MFHFPLHPDAPYLLHTRKRLETLPGQPEKRHQDAHIPRNDDPKPIHDEKTRKKGILGASRAYKTDHGRRSRAGKPTVTPETGGRGISPKAGRGISPTPFTRTATSRLRVRKPYSFF